MRTSRIAAKTVTNSASALSREISALASRIIVATCVAATQRGALVERLADGHEEAAGQALAGDVADQEEEPVGVEHEEVVEIAAHLARRLEHDVEIEAPLAGKHVDRLGQDAHLDAARRLQLAREARRRLALLLDLAA